MIELIAFLFPSFIAVQLYNHLHKNRLLTRDLVAYYFIFATLITLAAYVTAVYVFNEPKIIFTDIFAIKYMIVSVVFALLFPVALFAASKGLNISVEDREKSK